MDILSKKTIKLSDQIRQTIGYRIALCFFITMIVILALTFYDLVSGIKELEKNLDLQCNSLAEYTISQILINSPEAIKLKLDSLNENNKAIKYNWENKSVSDRRLMKWKFPFSWKYIYPIKNLDGSNFGSFVIIGTFLYDQALISELETRIFLLSVFLILMFSVLYPLSKKIPKKLFIAPVDNLLQILRSENDNISKVELLSVPEEINEIRDKIIILLRDAEARSRANALSQIAAQVAHDIRGPLSSLNNAVNDTSSSPEKKQDNIRNFTIRINDIADNLLSIYRQEKAKNNEILSSEAAIILLDNIIAEKRIRIKNPNIEIKFNVKKNSYNAFIEVEASDFKRVLSNIIDNSLESFKDSGLIEITLRSESRKVYIVIKDNGCGVPKDKIHLIFEEGESFGKKNGSGLGLPYIVNKINLWNGDYEFYSEVGKGTEFEIVLPQTRAAPWCVSEINVAQNIKIVILDDNGYIHDIWKKRFSNEVSNKYGVELLHFYTSQELTDFCQVNNLDKIFFMLDYELIGSEETGLILAEKLNLSSKSILVTSLYDSSEIRENCKKIKMKILPKSFAEFVPIHFFEDTQIVFVDDDENITNIWLERAKLANKKLKVFNDVKDFMKIYHSLEKETFIYMDSSLGGNLKGENFAKILYDEGYHNIILATGYPTENFKDFFWLKDIIGKEPPF